MRKLFYIWLVLMVVLIAWLLTKQGAQKPPTSEPTNTVVEPQQPQPKTNLVKLASSVAPVEAVSQPTNIIEAIQPLDALMATNLKQWQMAISGLHPLAGFTTRQDWMMEQTNRTEGVPILLQENGKTVSYKVRFINVNASNDGDIQSVMMHSPIMNIEETRELGLQLCNMLGQDPSDFSAWCDKVGNHWLDAPLYDGFSVPIPNSNKFCGFGIGRTSNDEKPWRIDFFITSP